jgi:hypothetical protein
MNAPPNLPELPVQVGGALAVPTQPTEMAYPLRRDEFDLLCETETINEDKRWRDISIAFFAAAFAGLIGLIGSIDWDSTFKNQHWTPLVHTSILGVVTLSSFVIFIIQQIKIRKKPVSSGYVRIKARISAHYQQHRDLSDADRWVVLSNRLWKAARAVHGTVGGSINGPVRNGASIDAEMRTNLGIYRINVPDSASFDEAELLAIQQIKNTDAKVAAAKDAEVKAAERKAATAPPSPPVN